uniref:phosphatidate phosphatase n=1 Tax=Nothobranchius furzeri TaxID=105023 RepID=A0A8C6KNL4_NOTFU
MNYVGQLAGQVFVQVKELYRGLNPATLSGCIDVIVVRQPDDSLQCSPFHVRFGKMGVLRSREKVVDMEINGVPVDLHMKLGDNGEAFFVRETENGQEVIPSYLATSPILSDGAVLMSPPLLGKSPGPPVQTLGSMGSSGETKKRRKRRRKSRADSTRREESGDYSADEDMFSIDMSSDEGGEGEKNRSASREALGDETAALSSFKQNGVHTRSDGEWSPARSPSNYRPTSPKSDSELITNMSDSDSQNPAMHWAWGELPQAATVPSRPPSHYLFCSSPIPYISLLCSQPSFLPLKSSPPPVYPVSIPVTQNTHFRAIPREMPSGPRRACCEMPARRLVMEEEGVAKEESDGVESESVRAKAPALASETRADMEEMSLRPLGKTDSPKRKDKRSRHLGADGVYLDDLTDLEPEVAALYFPKSVSDPGLHSSSQSPQSMSSGGDSGVDSYCDPMSDLPSIAVSLCGGLNDNKEITKEEFQDKIISYQQFMENPSIIDDPNLVVKKLCSWSCLGVFLLFFAAVEKIMKEKMPKKGGRWWFSWRGRNSNTKPVRSETRGVFSLCAVEKSSSSDEDHLAAKQSSPIIQSEPGPPPGGVSYKKTLRLTSDQLLSLQLLDGPNDVVFSVTTQYQGTCRCQGTIYLWNWDDKIIISDIDGTITRSDTLGHILPTLGKDWTHQGIAHLYHKVSQNGYKFLYCSARAIGMADMTRGYLNWVNERGTMLPMGPVLLSPSSLFSALHREVIEKKPEKFKVECLTDIKHLFYPNTQPFYAAFGNRPTDVYSYKEVGVPLNRIFTVNPKGELVQEHAKTNISSYARLGEVVDHVFPLKARSSSSDFPCSDTFSHFTYWREQLPQVDAQETTS